MSLKVTAVAPASAPAGSPDPIVLHVLGYDFTPDSTVTFDGVPLHVSFVSSSELTCRIEPARYPKPRTVAVAVETGLLACSAVPFTFT
jgi:IPT/TIG domain